MTDYLEGVLNGEVRVRFEAHLAGCEGCAAHQDQMRRTLLLTGTLGTESLPVEGRDRLLDAFRGGGTLIEQMRGHRGNLRSAPKAESARAPRSRRGSRKVPSLFITL